MVVIILASVESFVWLADVGVFAIGVTVTMSVIVSGVGVVMGVIMVVGSGLEVVGIVGIFVFGAGGRVVGIFVGKAVGMFVVGFGVTVLAFGTVVGIRVVLGSCVVALGVGDCIGVVETMAIGVEASTVVGIFVVGLCVVLIMEILVGTSIPAAVLGLVGATVLSLPLGVTETSFCGVFGVVTRFKSEISVERVRLRREFSVVASLLDCFTGSRVVEACAGKILDGITVTDF